MKLMPLIADGVGTRAIFDSLNKKQALRALKRGGLSSDDIKILKNILGMKLIILH